MFDIDANLIHFQCPNCGSELEHAASVTATASVAADAVIRLSKRAIQPVICIPA